MLLAHRVYRNKQKKATGDGERKLVGTSYHSPAIMSNIIPSCTHTTDDVAETQEDRDSRMELYDQVLVRFLLACMSFNNTLFMNIIHCLLGDRTI